MGYMAREQLLGQAVPGSDYYELGATGLAMLAGRDAQKPMEAGDEDSWKKRVEMSRGMQEALEKLLTVRVADRLQDPEELRQALASNLDESGESFLARTRALETVKDRLTALKSDVKAWRDRRRSRHKCRAI